MSSTSLKQLIENTRPPGDPQVCQYNVIETSSNAEFSVVSGTAGKQIRLYNLSVYCESTNASLSGIIRVKDGDNGSSIWVGRLKPNTLLSAILDYSQNPIKLAAAANLRCQVVGIPNHHQTAVSAVYQRY